MPPKKITSFALTEEGRQLLRMVAAHMGLPLTGTLEVLIRERADREGLRAPANPTPVPP
jgi:predicted nucleic acid-binding protein